jgi:iron-sulfur cluster repair protein YtfE (RIC family)
MEILAPLGIDLCCGGSYPLSEALDLHHVDRAVVVPRVLEIIAKGTRR